MAALANSAEVGVPRDHSWECTAGVVSGSRGGREEADRAAGPDW